MELSGQGYVKMVLHGVKYPGEAVLGLLAGRRRNGVWTVEEAVPLAHGPLLSAPLAAALLQVRDHSFLSLELY